MRTLFQSTSGPCRLALAGWLALGVGGLAQPPVLTHPRVSTVAGLPAAAAGNKGQIWSVTDGNSATDCTVGTGATVVLCQSSGAAWVAVGGGVTDHGALTGLTPDDDHTQYVLDSSTADQTITQNSRLILSLRDDLTVGVGPLSLGDDGTSHSVVVQGTGTQAGDYFNVQTSGADYLFKVDSGGAIQTQASITLGSAGIPGVSFYAPTRGLDNRPEYSFWGDIDTGFRNCNSTPKALCLGIDAVNVFSATSNGDMLLEGATANDFETLFDVTDPTADRTIVVPDTSGTMVVSAYGELTEEDIDGTPATTITCTTAGTYYPWITASSGDVSGTTADLADATGDNIQIDTGNGGTYRISVAFSFSGTVNATISCFVFDTGVRTGIGFVRKLGAGGDVGSAMGSGLYVAAAADEFSLRCTCGTNGDVINPWVVNLSLTRVQ